jgi:hypothetical protein
MEELIENSEVKGSCLPCKNTKTREWYAWNDLRPPHPDYFHITGEIWVANPGVSAFLTPTEPQGINPTILMLDLYLCQQPGFWAQVLLWKPVRFEKKIAAGYSEAHIMCGGAVVAAVPVNTVH